MNLKQYMVCQSQMGRKNKIYLFLNIFDLKMNSKLICNYWLLLNYLLLKRFIQNHCQPNKNWGIINSQLSKSLNFNRPPNNFCKINLLLCCERLILWMINLLFCDTPIVYWCTHCLMKGIEVEKDTCSVETLLFNWK